MSESTLIEAGVPGARYTDIADAPLWHREAARLLVMGYSTADAAKFVGVAARTLQGVLEHEPFMEHMRHLQARIALESDRQHDKLNKLFSGGMDAIEKAVEKMKAHLGSEGVTVDEAILIVREMRALTGEIADRLPGRAFTKVSKTESKTLGLLRVEKSSDTEDDPARTALRSRMQALDAQGVPAAVGSSLSSPAVAGACGIPTTAAQEPDGEGVDGDF